MKVKRNNLEKLIALIVEISSQPENEWFKNELIKKLTTDLSDNNSTAINEIYEYCIQLIIKGQAERFYEDFKLETIKANLIKDFVRMEKFRRENNFEDFCLAMFQQIEGIVNALLNEEIQTYLVTQKDTVTHKVRNRETGVYEEQVLWQLIFYPLLLEDDLKKKLNKSIFEWDFAERFKTVLFIYYFNKKLYNYNEFQTIFFIGHELYQSRNLNHRGSILTIMQQKTIDKVILNSHKYFFKFMGFLEDITTKININIK